MVIAGQKLDQNAILPCKCHIASCKSIDVHLPMKVGFLV